MAHDSHRRTPRPASRDHEAAFSVVELMVVTLIVAILMTLGGLGIRGARLSAHREAAISAARSYAQAAEQYAGDHGGKMPDIGGREWPTASVMYGPIEPLAAGTPERVSYLRGGAPDAVRDGLAKIVEGSASTPSGSSAVVLAYDRPTPTSYVIRVFIDGRLECATGSAAPDQRVRDCR